MLLLSLLVLSVHATELILSGKCGDNATWILDRTTGILTVSGTGKMYDKDAFELGWSDSPCHVVIEEGITHVGAKNFGLCGMLTSVSLPDTLASFGNGAFGMTSELEEIMIPAKVTVLPDELFCHSSLQKITIKGAITHIGKLAFGPCNGLTSFPFKEGLLTIDENAFAACYALTDINLPVSLQSVGKDAFLYCTAKVTVNNPDCIIADSEGTLGTPGTTVIYGIKGSTAETYAKKYSYEFRELPPDCSAGRHTYGTPVGTAATCTTPGYDTYRCTSCGHSCTKETTKALGHSYESKDIPATTTEQGYTQHTCTRCGHVYKDNYTQIHTHRYTDTVVPPTCEEGGYTLHECACGDSYRDAETEPLGHIWAENPEGTQKISSLCGATEPIVKREYDAPNGIWNEAHEEDYTIEIGDMTGQVTDIQVDGVSLTESDYTVTETGITLSGAYLRTLPEGSHSILVELTDGTAQLTLTVNPAADAQAPEQTQPIPPTPTEPQEQPVKKSSPLLWIVLGVLLTAGLGIGGFFLYRKFLDNPTSTEENEI